MLRPLYEMTPIHTGVIDEVGDSVMRSAYFDCRRITRYHARTFYLAARFLPYEKQRAIFAIYAICRYLDDMVDEAEDLLSNSRIDREGIRDRLEGFRDSLLQHYSGGVTRDPVLTAFCDVLRRYRIPVKLPLELMQGVASDLEKNRYASFDELYAYSYKVASTVGLMTSEVFGYRDERALGHAIDLGIAMQLTNILRDIGEDLRMDRIYLPADELALFNVSEAQLFDAQIDGNFIKLMRFQIARARRYFESADRGIPMLSRDSRLPVLLARENYSSILDKIEKNDYRVFNRRAFLNTVEKLAILPRLYLKSKREYLVNGA